MRRRAFTLLELLVVIAVMAALAGLAALAFFQVMGSSERDYDRLNWHTHRRNGVTKPRSTPHQILFIGNSYTEVNHLPEMVQALFTAAGDQPKVEVKSHLVGGSTLEDHWNNAAVQTLLVDTEWDFVVLQEQSMRPLLDRKAMHDYARKLDEVIHKHKAITLFFETWARQALPATQTELNDAYLTITSKLSAEVAPAGQAWKLSLEAAPSRVLHQADGSHPNPTGSYLAALTFYAVIADRTPEGLPGRVDALGQTLVDIPAAEALDLQKIAWRAVADTRRGLRQLKDKRMAPGLCIRT